MKDIGIKKSFDVFKMLIAAFFGVSFVLAIAF